MQKAFIYGAGGFGVEVLNILRQADTVEPVAFLDSDPHKHGTTVDGLPVIGGPHAVAALTDDNVRCGIVAIGENVTRAAIADTLADRGVELISAIDPLASISPSATIGRHVIIGPRAIICVHANVGDHSVLSAGAIADHDAHIGRAAFLGPAVRLAGGVRVDDFARLEIGAAVIPGRHVHAGALVQAGAVVIGDVAGGVHVTGIPAASSGNHPRSRFVPAQPELEDPTIPKPPPGQQL
jgi:UDP-perosamine 4-acetyltransferase